MTMPDFSSVNIYIPDPIGALELNISDEWRGRFTKADTLPENAPLAYGYAVPFMGDKGYVTRDSDAATWGVIEGPFEEGETPEAWLARTAMAQVGATVGRAELMGFLDCKATSHNKQYEPGAITVRPIYLLVAKEIEDVPEESGYARRRLPLNKHAEAIRQRYPELSRYMSHALDRYMVLRAKGEA